MENLSNTQNAPEDMLHSISSGKPVGKKMNSLTKVILGLSIITAVVILSELAYYFYNKSAPEETLKQKSSAQQTTINKFYLDQLYNIEEFIKKRPNLVDQVEFKIRYSGITTEITQINEIYDGYTHLYRIGIQKGPNETVTIWLTDIEVETASVVRQINGGGKTSIPIDISKVKKGDDINLTILYDVLDTNNHTKISIEVLE